MFDWTLTGKRARKKKPKEMFENRANSTPQKIKWSN